MKKRLFCFLLAAMLIVGVMPMAALADGEVSANPGGKASVSISISGADYAAFKALISYDHDALTLDNVTIGSAVSAGDDEGDVSDLSNGISLYDGEKQVTFVRVDNMSSDQMKLDFTVASAAAAGDYTVTVSATEAKAVNGDDEQDVDPASITFSTGKITVEEPTYKLGDVYVDGTVDNADLMYMARHLANWSGYEEINQAAADVYADGSIDNADLMYLARYLANWSGYTLE